MNKFIFPRALLIAAKTFADKPQIIGEVLVVLCGGVAKKSLTEVQKYILAECREEIEDLAAKRKVNAERKRRQRNGGVK